MSYAGMGIAIPMGVTARRVTARRGGSARGWGRGVGGYVGTLGAVSPSAGTNPQPADMVITQVEADAEAAARAVIAASAAARRSPIAAVRTFQQTYGHGLTADGIYGPLTRSALVTVTGRSDLPPVTSSGGGGGGTVAPTTTSTPVDTTAAFAPSESTMSWMIPVAVAGTLVTVAGVLFLRRRKVQANRRRSRRRR